MRSFLVLAALAAGCTSFGGSDGRGSDSGAPSDAQAAGPADTGVAVPAPSAYADLVLADNPRLYWRLGETSGAFSDRSGSHPGEPTGPLRRGEASLLAGDSDPSVRMLGGSIAAQPSADLDFPADAPYTLELWIRIDADPVGAPDILTLVEGNSGIRLFFEGGSRKILSSRRESGVGAEHGGALLTLGAAHHVVTTYDGTALRLYIDGVADDLTNIPVPLAAHTYAATIGAKSGGAALDGFIDEVAIYDHALVQSTITEHRRVGSSKL